MGYPSTILGTNMILLDMNKTFLWLVGVNVALTLITAAGLIAIWIKLRKGN